jgi:hypothetical protein
MEERYPVGVTPSCAVAVLRHDERGDAYASWSTAIAFRGGEATIRVPGHYPGILAERLRSAAERFSPGRRLTRDEYLDLTAVGSGSEETIALSSTARSPVRVTMEVPRDEVEELAGLLAEAQTLIETLRRGLGLVPDSLPDPR